MDRFSKIIRPIILSFVIVLGGAVDEAWAGCDDTCPWDGAGNFAYCEDDDIGPAMCYYDDDHYYADFAGC